MNIICGTLTLILNLYLVFLCVYLIQNGTTDTYRLPLAVDAEPSSERSSATKHPTDVGKGYTDLPTYNLNDLPSECNNNLVVDDGYYVCTYSIPSKQKEHLNGVIVMLAFQYILGYALKLEIPLYIKGLESFKKLYKYYIYALDTARLAVESLYDLGFYLAQRRVYAHLCVMLVLILLQYL